MSSASDWLNENSGGGEQHDAVAFTNVGDGVRGRIMDKPKALMTQFGERLLINLDTEVGPRSLWVKPGNMAGAIRKACADAGVTDLTVGATLAIAFVGEIDTGKGNPAKQFEAKYVPPAASTATTGGVFDGL